MPVFISSTSSRLLTMAAAVLLGTSIAGTSTAQGAVIAYEPFAVGSNPAAGEYTADPLTGQGPSSQGFSGNWTTSLGSTDGFQASGGGSLANPGFATSGGQAIDAGGSGQRWVYRNVATGYPSAPTYYMSGYIRLDSLPTAEGIAVGGFVRGNVDGANFFSPSGAMNQEGLMFGFQAVDSGSSVSTDLILRHRQNSGGIAMTNDVLLSDVSAGELFHVVMKLERDVVSPVVTGNDRVSVWVNPDYSALEGTPDFVFADYSLSQYFHIERLALASSIDSQLTFDEFRFGTAWSDVVVAVPEPGSIALMLACCGVGMWRWKRNGMGEV